jgi:hypothetical protein
MLQQMVYLITVCMYVPNYYWVLNVLELHCGPPHYFYAQPAAWLVTRHRLGNLLGLRMTRTRVPCFEITSVLPVDQQLVASGSLPRAEGHVPVAYLK